MKLLTELSPKAADHTIATTKESKESSETETSEEQITPKEIPGLEPIVYAKVVDIAKSTAISIWEWKKDTCCLMPQNCCLLSDKCCLTKLRCVRQLKDKLVSKEADA